MKEVQKHGKEIGLEELKVLQMDVLQAVDEFCTEHNIRYSMACGTLLGAIRHKGYIPWDDDIDIYLLRDDYERLMKEFPCVYNGCYCISSLERDKIWDKPYAKGFDNRTIVEEYGDYDGKFGVNIDIFPVDEVPDDEKEWKTYDDQRRKLYLKYAKLVAIIPFRFTPMGIVRWFKWNFPKWFSSKSRRCMAEIIDENSKKWRNSGYKRVFECCQGILQKKPFDASVFDDIISFPFEDQQFKGFKNYDEYLRNGFGDYMTLPPIEQQKPHHSFTAYWKE